jgi:hypothetical protein
VDKRTVMFLGGLVFVTGLIAGLFLRDSLASVPEKANRLPEASSGTAAADELAALPAAPEAPEDEAVTYLPVTTKDSGQLASTPPPAATAIPTVTPATTRVLPADAIVVDHTSVDDFERIPDEYIEAAQNLRMLFIDASVGDNIHQGLDCLAYASNEAAPAGCKKYEHVVPAFSSSPEEVNWSRAGGYNRDNWSYQFWPHECGGWYDKVACFERIVSATINQYDVFSPQFSYLDVMATSIDGSIADTLGGFFSDNTEANDVYDLEAFIAQHPDKTFIFATTSLARSIGTEVSESFNNQMRDYAIANGHVLFDIADIVSHDLDGSPCYDNRDGVAYDGGPYGAEDYPDDNLSLEAICQRYTVEPNNGHLANPSVGKIRVAKAFWVLMARIAGWDGN